MTLTEFIKVHALDNYEAGGWDVIVECWTDEQITSTLMEFGATNEAEAVKAFEGFVDVWADRQAEARFQGEW
jgi:hypothetical protein